MTKLRQSANGQPCMNCGRIDDTVVLCHYSGIRQHAFGKGTRIKGHDLAAAPQCSRCHATGPFAEGNLDPDAGDRLQQQIDKSERQLFQILMWHIWRDEHGS